MQLVPLTEVFADRLAYVGLVPNREALSEVRLPQPHSILFLAMDGKDWPEKEAVAIARGLLDRGVVYMSAWGPGAGWVETIFDLAYVARELEGAKDQFVMTTSHENESLEHALWFATNAAWPEDAFEASCRSVVALVVGDQTWHDRIHSYLIAGTPLLDEA